MRIARPSPALVIALLALFVALGSTGVVASPAVNSAASLGKSVKKALKSAKTADKRSKRALKAAKSADLKAAQALAAGGKPGANGSNGANGSPAGSVISGNTDQTLPGTGGGAFDFAPSGFTPTGTGGGGAMSTQVSPNTAVVAGDLFVRIETAPGTAAQTDRTRTFSLAGVIPSLQCQIAAAATTCNSGNQAVTIPAGTDLVFATIKSGVTMNANAGTRWSFRLLT